ncbi:MAG: hypothetical protein V7638_196 [Acidobacteriota bacterium]
MALQTSNLTLVGLGSAKDTPPNSEQPPLIDGIHLRWAFKRELGFPWHGFYLFRRVHNPGTLTWLSQHTANLPPGPFGGNSLDTPLGRVFSDTNFVLTENFPPPPNAVEFDLANRNVLGMVFPEQTPVRRVDARIGFRLRPGDPPPTRSTVSFRNRATGQIDNPLQEQGCSFTALDQQNRVREHNVIRSIQTDTETITGLGCKFKLEITLPQSANFVEVKLTGAGRRNALDGAPTIEIFNGQTRLAIVSMKDASSRTTETHLLTGINITRIVIDEQLSPIVTEMEDSQDRLILNDLTFGNGTLYEVGLTAFAGAVPVREKTARGYAGRIVTEQLEFEGITSVEISSGPAALIDLGTVPFTQGSTNGWAKLSGVPYPLRLPITHPDYPCTPQAPENFSAARQLATDRIKYGSPQQFTGSPTPVTNTGTISVTNGSPIVVGTNTNWTNALVDAVVQVGTDATVYSIVMVVSPTKLVLSRNYTGASRNGVQYNISRDKFGQFYSYLANLVAGGRNAGSMVTRTLPAPVTKSGTVALQKDSAIVTGTGTSWTASLAGLDLELNDTVFAIASVESATKLTLEKAYQGDNQSGLSYSIRPRLQSSTTSAIAPRMPAQLPLDLVLLGSLHPAVAQMSGLYWADVTADPDLKYDYLIVSDHNNVAQLNPDTMLTIIGQSGFANLDAAIVYDLRVAPASALARPKDLEVYALPGSSRLNAAGSAEEAVNNVGLRWDLNKTDAGVLLPGRSVMYHLWRANLGNGTFPNANPQYSLVTKNWPILVVDSAGTRPVSSDWPPFTLHALDNALADGWWGYQVSGIDVFGRHTPNSFAAAWRQWSPSPEPKPWYYQDPPSDAIIHQSAIRLLTKIAPPQPTATEAFAIDRRDPMIIKDAAYRNWWDNLTRSDWYKALNEDQKNNLIGLRVSWQWPQTHIDQAPHTREFRIYYQDGTLNTVLGNTVTVTSAGNNESIVTTDIPLSEAANRFAGAALYVGEDVFVIVGSDSVSPLRVRVRNVGTRNEIAPRANAPCTIATPAAFASGLASVASGSRVVTGAGTNWTKALENMVFQIATDQRSYRVVSVSSQTHLTLDEPYEGVTKGDRVYSIRHPRFIDYSESVNWQRRYYVVSQDQHWTPGTDPAGKPVRNYEIFLPVPEEGAQPGVPLTATPASPIVYAHVGVSAADDKTYTPDDQKWPAPWGNRPGNEGRVGPPTKIFRVLREKPAAPVLPRMPEQLSATRVDQNGSSSYTFRWLPLAQTMTHLFRAYDEAIFKTDWSQRPRGVLDPTKLELFPSESIDPRWNLAKRQQVANELNKLNAFAHDAAGTALAFTHYRALSPDALRVLAGLRETDAAFTQLTSSPLDPNDPANANRRGPDDPASFQIGDPNNPLASTALRAFVDSVDGLLKNRYFYRAANIDAAHNLSLFSLSTPAVSVPDVRPLEAPVITRVLSGDHRVLVRWTHGHPVDVSRFNLYRTDQLALSTDPRTMLLRETVPSVRRMEVTVEGTARLRYAGGVQQIIGVYRRDQADPLASPPHNQPPGATNFWQEADTRAVMLPDTDGYGATLYGLGALPAGTEVTIVIRDKKGIERLVDSLPLEFDDKAVDPGRDYFYCLTAVRVVVQGSTSSEIESEVSRIARCRPVGLSSQTTLR